MWQFREIIGQFIIMRKKGKNVTVLMVILSNKIMLNYPKKNLKGVRVIYHLFTGDGIGICQSTIYLEEDDTYYSNYKWAWEVR